MLSVCPKRLLQSICRISSNEPVYDCSNDDFAKVNLLFLEWKNKVQSFAHVFDRAPSIFISHAWHYSTDVQNLVTSEKALLISKYYDQLCREIFVILRSAGFNVYFDRDFANNDGICSNGTKRFMEKVLEVDIVISICSPLYCARSRCASGVREEVNHIIQRYRTTDSLQFYIPVLVHAEDVDFLSSSLLPDVDKTLDNAVWIDFRDCKTFLSNMWHLLHRICQICSHSCSAEEFSPRCQMRLLSIFEKLLGFDDYFSLTLHTTVPSRKKSILEELFLDLQVAVEPFQERISLNFTATEIKSGELLFQEGDKYEKGLQGVLPNVWKAKDLYKRACETSHPEAHYRLAMLFLLDELETNKTKTRRENWDEGVGYLKLACDLGHSGALFTLSSYHMVGSYGLSLDRDLSFLLLIRAAEKGYEPAIQLTIQELKKGSVDVTNPLFRFCLNSLLKVIHGLFTRGSLYDACFSDSWNFQYLLWYLFEIRAELPLFEFLITLKPSLLHDDKYWNQYNTSLFHQLLEEWDLLVDDDWFKNLFFLILSQFNYLEMLNHEGKSFLDITSENLNFFAFKVLIERGAGKRINPVLVFKLYKRTIVNPEGISNFTLSERSEVFLKLEDRNRYWKFFLSAEYIIGELASPSSLSSVQLTGNASGVKFLPVSVFEHGNRIRRMENNGRACVASAHRLHYSLYFKFLPELSGIERAVQYFSELILGFGTSLSEVFRVDHNVEIEVFRSKKYRNSEVVRIGNIPVLVSLGVDGPLLKDVFQMKKLIDYRLDEHYLFCSIIFAMLVNPEDGKSDNYVLEKSISPSSSTEYYRPVCVDNDHSFVPALIEVSQAKARVNTRTVLFAFDAMTEPVPVSVVNHFLGLDVDSILRTWLCLCRTLNTQLLELFPDLQHKRFLFQRYHCFIGIPFANRQIAHLYTKLFKLKNCFNHHLISSKEITPMELFLELEPCLRDKYGKQIRDLKYLSPDERFAVIEGESAIRTMSRPMDILTGYHIPNDSQTRDDILQGKQYSPGQATDELEEIIEQTLHFRLVAAGEFDLFYKLKRADHIEEFIHKLPFHELPAHICTLYLDSILEKMLHFNINKLHLHRHPSISMKHFNALSTDSFNRITHLSLIGCPNVTDSVVQLISEKAVQLFYLNLSSCIAISVIGQRGMLSTNPLSFPSLVYLNLNDCRSLITVNVNAPVLQSLLVERNYMLKVLKYNAPNLVHVAVNILAVPGLMIIR
jgi:hypothetical protein